jgi:hypothetical protein
MKKISIFLLCIILTASLFTACASSKNESDYNDGYSGAPAMPEAPAEEPAAQPEKGSGMPGSDTGTTNPNDFGGHKVILTYELSIETDTFDEDMAFIMQQVQAAGGYAESSSISGRKPVTYNDTGRYATIALRIPADKANAFVNSAKGVGTLLSSNEYADDISAEYFDRETRLEVLRIQLDRLKNILVQTDNLADIIQLESEIARVTLEIEQMTSELRRWDNLVAYATVKIYIDELSPIEGPADEATVGERISKGFTSTLTGVGVFFQNLFVFLISASPVLIIIGAIITVVLLLVKRRNKKKAAKLLNNEPPRGNT